MPNVIQHKRNSTPGSIPNATGIQQGELAINIGDGRLYTKNSSNTVINLGITSISGTTITPASGNFSSSLQVNNVSVSISGHTHTSSNITDFGSAVSGLINVKDLIAGSNVTLSNSNGIFTISSAGGGGGSSIAPIVRGSFILTSSSGTFNVPGGYTVGSLDIFLNGVKLSASGDYTASNGTSFTLTESAPSGSVVEFLSLVPGSNIGNATGSGLLVFNTSPTFSGVPLVPTAASGTNTSQIASTEFVRTEISNLVASAPSTLDTLNELAAALGNDANFSTTVTNNLAGKANLSGATFTGTISAPSGNFTQTVNIASQTANTIAGFDASKNVTSLSTATYPSLTELSYVKGVTSALQTQINSKQNSLTNPVTGTGIANHVAYWSSSSGIVADSGQLFWDATNNRLGVGTSSPSGELHVIGTGIFSSGLLVNGVNVSVSGHTHTANNIIDFSTEVANLLNAPDYSSTLDNIWVKSLLVNDVDYSPAALVVDANGLTVYNFAVPGGTVLEVIRNAGVYINGDVIIGNTDYKDGAISIAGGITNHTASVFRATDNQPPASAFATLDTRNSIAVLDFDDTTKETAVFVGIMSPQTYLPSGLSIRCHWMATSATTGAVRWEVSLERCNTDLDSDSFDTVATGSSTTNGTAGIPTVTSITLTTIDGVTAGDLYRLRVSRDAANGADTMVGDAELVAVEVRSAV